ncbi:hypothetical protein DEU56DRAFT_912865 [Suillus clintonianus]|uniref:uncharacterized protein n=1 Tax=Suillus clintonianus TaxID=1904413 RepID=UPI001B875D65|nr:uncharacterized protein DEU56DRAFT_912865 [Suillus clintonianus]KAG2137093.1 hypothetical protein DEU56DRAFT_912865 [Suillus clintonianus]
MSQQLIRDVGITYGDEALVSFYVELLRYGLALAVLCNRSAHHLPLGVGLSLYVLLRFVQDILELGDKSLSEWRTLGSIGVMKSMTAEMPDSTNMARAWASVPLAWSSGTTLGSLIGGELARPADRFPSIFGGSEITFYLAVRGPCYCLSVGMVCRCSLLEEPLAFAKLHDVMGPKQLWLFSVACGTIAARSSTVRQSSDAIGEELTRPVELKDTSWVSRRSMRR